MVVYTPLNINVFIAAMAGALSGMNAERWNNDGTALDYANMAAAAGAYAQQFDQVWAGAPVDEFQFEMIQEISEASWENRSGLNASQVRTDYNQVVTALIAIISAGESYLAGIGVTPLPIGSDGGLAVYGDGSDGTFTFDGVATHGAFSLAGSTYTQLRDVFFQSFTINAGVTVKMSGWRFFCQGTGNIPATASLNNDGNPGVLGVAGDATSGPHTLGTGKAGGAGAANGAGTAGSATAHAVLSANNAGAGGGDGTHAGGAGGAATTDNPALNPRSILYLAQGTLSAADGGPGGGGGASDNADTTGGGGGG